MVWTRNQVGCFGKGYEIMNTKTIRLLAAEVTEREQFRSRSPASMRRGNKRWAGSQLKRLMDTFIASIAVLALAPLLMLVALMVRFTSPGPILYGHKRVGHNGRTFRCWKFRSMVTDADKALARHLDASPEARREWEETHKLRNDPRITPIGQVLREKSIDELPQLFNVLMGDMSLVGPRPVVKDELSRYGSSARHYLSARPGVTGLWQVSGRSETDYARRVALDRAYVQNCGILMDMKILLQTIPVVLKARGSW